MPLMISTPLSRHPDFRHRYTSFFSGTPSGLLMKLIIFLGIANRFEAPYQKYSASVQATAGGIGMETMEYIYIL